MKSLYESILGSTNTGRSTFEVDLGLSVNWCSCNVGANRPEEAGLYFAWGDTKGYKASEIGGDMFSSRWYEKIPASELYGNLKLKDDAAHVYMKGKWRMPTRKECKELIDNTTRNTEILNGVKGIRCTSKKNNNSIFIPLSGDYNNYPDEGCVNSDIDRYLNFWTSTYSSEEGGKSWRAYAYFDNLNIGKLVRFYGMSIRAVCSK